MVQAKELPIDTDATAEQMAEAIFGTGIEIKTATYTGADSASGIYSDGDAVSAMLTPGDTGVILSTGKATDVTNSSGDANVKSSTSTSHGTSGDSDLTEIAGSQTYDAAVFEATFVPEGSTLTMQVVFGSEEYLEYCNSGFNDAVVVMVNGVKAELTVGDGDITINNINDESNSNFYIDNPANAETLNTEMDGITVSLTLKAPVTPGEVNDIKIAIADGGDSTYDSNLLIAGGSVQTALIAEDDDVTISEGATKDIDVLANDSTTAAGSLTIVAINGHPVVAGDSILLSTGETITLNDDGTLTVEAEDDEGSDSFSYTVEDSVGNTDTAFVNLTTTPCFLQGTPIQTPRGQVRVENLRPGDLVTTLDHGEQVVRWIGCTHPTAENIGDISDPIRVRAGALGNGLPRADIFVSPQHRMFVSSVIAARMFGVPEVLIPAIKLIGIPGIEVNTTKAPVRYFHLLFDRHEIVFTEGAPSESLLTGPQAMELLSPVGRAQVLALYPEAAMPGYKASPVRLIPKGPQLRKLVARHIANTKPLLSSRWTAKHQLDLEVV